MPKTNDPMTRVLTDEEIDAAVLSCPYSPTGAKVVVYVPPVEEVSSGGIIFAGADGLQREHRGQVHGYLVAIGSEAWREYPGTCEEMRIGQRVSYGRYEGRGADNDMEYRVMNDLDIDCIVDPEKWTAVEVRKNKRAGRAA